ncbi:hypothetical protein Tco_0737474 [Tanacetum coccineum]
MSKVLQERGFGSLPSSTEANPRDQVKSISTTIEADSYPIRRIGSSQHDVSTGQNRTLMYETRQMTIPFLSRLNGASVSLMPLSTYLNLGLGELAHTKLIVELADMTVKYPKGIAENVLITLRIREERIIFKSVKPNSSLIKRVYMLSLRERMELDLEARLMGENLVINRSLDPLNGDYIELNDLNKPFELRRNQGDDLMPTIEEGEEIEEFKTRDDELDTGIGDYPSFCDYDKKIHIDYAHNLKFSCMIGIEFTHANFFPLFMDAYRDEGIGPVIFGEPFLREVRINTRWFEGTITIYDDNESVTHQMVRSHPRFKHHTNEQCNKIPPLLKVSDEDKNNGISHPYQKLKVFYKGVLNLRPDYIRDAKTKEWLIHGHISVHEME